MINSQRGKRIVDLCIYVDENVYKENHDREKIFDALYRIVHSLAVKGKLFKNWSDYDGFALDYSFKLYYRLINKKQFLPDDDPNKLKKVKSILNYVKKTIHPAKVDYQQQSFSQQFDPNLHPDLVLSVQDHCVNQCKQQVKPILKIDFEYYLSKISNTIKHCIKRTPYRNDKVISHQLYMSCLMTLLNQITLTNHNKQRFKNRLKNGYNVDDFINHIYQEEIENSIVTYHLPDNLYNYVATLVNIIKKLVVKDLRALIGNAEPSDSVVQSIISSSMGEHPNDQE